MPNRPKQPDPAHDNRLDTHDPGAHPEADKAPRSGNKHPTHDDLNRQNKNHNEQAGRR